MRQLGRQHESRLWPVLAMLLVAALVPSACVLWFMGEAMRNERLATRQRLLEIYRSPLERVRARLEEYWQGKITEMPSHDRFVSDPTEVLGEWVASGRSDGLLFYDLAGRPLYPDPPPGDARDFLAIGPEWEAAEALEFEAGDPGGAAALYLEVALAAHEPAVALRARIASARCAARMGMPAEAAHQLQEALDQPLHQRTHDADGRLLIADAGLLALQFLDSDRSQREQVARRLAGLAADYEVVIPAAQRRALMERLTPIVGAAAFPTLAGERLAAEYVEIGGPPPEPGRLARSAIPGVWQLTSSGCTTRVLYHQGHLDTILSGLLGDETISGATKRLLKPGERAPEPFLALRMADVFSDWQLALYLTGPEPFAAEGQRRITTYLWSGVGVALLTLLMTLFVGRFVGRQVTLTRLKNDLIATVSHELKTPLASIRALVDTLLDGSERDPRQRREYLELVARENLRLSRLIDNFLAFSRLERGKRTFDFARVSPAEIVSAAEQAAGERFTAPGCTLTIELADDLPDLIADLEALVTVLLNLLDNAWKYTPDDKRIALKVHADGDNVRFEVRDNGIGLSRRAARRIFDRFYQVDRTLSRRAGGCGLGLSIVKFIIEAHGGDIEVFSQPGTGSRFVATLPAADAARTSREAALNGSAV